MALERTLSILKPDATRRNLTGKINTMLEAGGLRIVAQKRIHLTKTQAEGFYAEHSTKGFFGGLTDFMSSAPVVVQVLEGENAIAKNPTPRTPPKVRSARPLRCQSTRTRPTGRIPPPAPRARFRTSSPRLRL